MCSLPGISLAPQEKRWQSPRRLLSAHLAPGGAKGWLGSAAGFIPAPCGSWVRPGAASLPHARHRSPCPGWATALAWGIPTHGQGESGCSWGPWHTTLTACHYLACGVQHQTALVSLVQDRQRASRDGVKWGGGEWLAWCRETATVGVPMPLTLSQQSRTLPHYAGKSLGLLPPRADGAARSATHPAPEGPPVPGSQHP